MNRIDQNNKLIAEFMNIKLFGGLKNIYAERNLKYFRKTNYKIDGFVFNLYEVIKHKKMKKYCKICDCQILDHHKHIEIIENNAIIFLCDNCRVEFTNFDHKGNNIEFKSECVQ